MAYKSKVVAKGYSEAGASTTRRALKGMNRSESGSPREDIDANNYTLRQRARLLYMSSPVATSAINTCRTKIVGCGLRLSSNIDADTLGISPDSAKAWQKIAETEFSLWAGKKENCDAIGMNNFYGLQQLALSSWLTSGDVFSLVKRYPASWSGPYTIRLQLIEADRVSTPSELMATPSVYLLEGTALNGNRIYDGVEINSDGLAVAYYIRNTYPSQITKEPTAWQRVEITGKRTGNPNIMHIMSSERCDQYRGVSYLAPVIEPLLQLRRYTESELMAALIQSFFTAWITTQTDPSQIPMNEVGIGEPGGDSEDRGVSDSDSEYEMGPGTINHLADGESIVFGDPNIPTAGFETFVKTMCALVGAALEIPADVLLKQFNSSYSASRAALMEAYEAFKMRRSWLVDDFCQPVYEIWLSEAVSSGRINAPGFFIDPRIRAAWCRADWIGPVQAQLDPVKESNANAIQVSHGWKTNQQVTREMGGGDWESNIDRAAQEQKKLRESGLQPSPVPAAEQTNSGNASTQKEGATNE